MPYFVTDRWPWNSQIDGVVPEAGQELSPETPNLEQMIGMGWVAESNDKPSTNTASVAQSKASADQASGGDDSAAGTDPAETTAGTEASTPAPEDPPKKRGLLGGRRKSKNKSD